MAEGDPCAERLSAGLLAAGYTHCMFGSHLSIAGSMSSALLEAESLGLECVQVFTKNQQQWKSRPLDPAEIRGWRAEVARLGWQSRTVSHASYLINLASPDDALYRKSIAAFIDEVERAKNRTKSTVRSKVEHVFGVMKLKFGFVKLRYRGLKKNANQLFAVCALVNLYLLRKKLLLLLAPA